MIIPHLPVVRTAYGPAVNCVEFPQRIQNNRTTDFELLDASIH